MVVYEMPRWQSAQIRAFAGLADLHPGEPCCTDTIAHAGQYGPVVVYFGEQAYLLREDGTAIAGDGTLVDPGVLA